MYRHVGADLYVQTRMYRLVGTDLYVQTRTYGLVQQTRVHLLAHSAKKATELVSLHRYSHEKKTNSVPKQCLYIIERKCGTDASKGVPHTSWPKSNTFDIT